MKTIQHNDEATDRIKRSCFTLWLPIATLLTLGTAAIYYSSEHSTAVNQALLAVHHCNERIDALEKALGDILTRQRVTVDEKKGDNTGEKVSTVGDVKTQNDISEGDDNTRENVVFKRDGSARENTAVVDENTGQVTYGDAVNGNDANAGQGRTVVKTNDTIFSGKARIRKRRMVSTPVSTIAGSGDAAHLYPVRHADDVMAEVRRTGQ